MRVAVEPRHPAGGIVTPIVIDDALSLTVADGILVVGTRRSVYHFPLDALLSWISVYDDMDEADLKST